MLRSSTGRFIAPRPQSEEQQGVYASTFVLTYDASLFASLTIDASATLRITASPAPTC